MIPALVRRVVGAALLVGASACAFLSLAAQGGRFSERLDLLTHFAPMYLGGGALALACLMFLPRGGARSGAAVAAGVAILSSLALMAPEALRRPPPAVTADTPLQLRIIQLNSWGLNDPDPRATARWLKEQKPDVVMVEELEPNLVDAIVRETGWRYTRGMLRTGIFTRADPAGSPFRLGKPWDDWPGLARTSIRFGGETIPLVAVHLTWPTDPVQARQRHQIGLLKGRTDPRRMIMLGDFNLTPWSFALQRLDRDLGMIRRDRALWSWPARAHGRAPHGPLAPWLPIDHVYAGSAWKTVSVTRGPRLASDHFPVIVVLALED